MIKQISHSIIYELKHVRFYIYLLFTLLYCLISLVNHYNYHTFAYDLGIYNNSIYQYGHLINNPHPYGHASVTNFLADHFSLYTVIVSPLHYIFGTYTLLYIQIASILFGGAGIYKLVKNWHPTTFLPEIALFHFFSFYGIFSALSFDYHDNVVGTMFVPWFLYFMQCNKLKYAAIVALLIVISKENMALWLFCICLGLLFIYKKDKLKRNFALITGICAILYAVIIITIVMPTMVKPGASASHFQYSILGNNLAELFETLIYKTKYITRALFCNVTTDRSVDGVKEETYACLLLSGGLFLLIRFEYAIMLLSIILQKVLSDDVGRWGITSQYSIEFAPIVVIALYASFNYFKNIKLKITIALIFCVLSFTTTLCVMFYRKSPWYSEIQCNIFKKSHYTSEYNKLDIDKISALIPKNAKLSTNNHLGSHLAFRTHIYLFPDVNDANYILVADVLYEFPMWGEELHNEIMKYKNSPNWQTITEINGIYLFKKIK